MNASKPSRMERSETMDWNFSDSEDSDGIDAFLPLKFVARVAPPDYRRSHAQGSETNSMDDPPKRADATTVRFEFIASSTVGEDGATRVRGSRFGIEPLPVRFMETVPSRTPAPQVKCRSEQHGKWLNGRCHVVKDLMEVCVQIEATDHGQWQVHKGDTADKIRGHTDSAQALGCDPKNQWAIGTYQIDPCWGHKHKTRSCPNVATKRREPHMIEVTLRSADDPLLMAENLTTNRFDFGSSVSSQRSLAFTLMGIAACMSCPTLFLLRRLRRKVNHSDEERESLTPSEFSGIPSATRVGVL
jgi:hypothetical protein